MSKKYKFNSDVVVTFNGGKMNLTTDGVRGIGNVDINNSEASFKKRYLTPIRTKLTPMQAANRLLNGEGVCSESGVYFSFINTAPSLKELRAVSYTHLTLPTKA